MDRFQYRGRISGGDKSRSSKKRTAETNSFPNYLVNKQEKERTNTEKKQEGTPSPFIADQLLDTRPGVPFLQQNKDAFHQHRESQKTTYRKNYFAEEKRRFNEEKRREKNSDLPSYALYKSRRPFRATEIPSLWSSLPKRTDAAIHYEKLKEELFVPTEDLILLDLHPPEDIEDEGNTHEKDERAVELPPKTKKALNRSLLGIMEQEKYQQSAWKNGDARPQKPSSTGYSSYFD